jgi:hypothetical protein
MELLLLVALPHWYMGSKEKVLNQAVNQKWERSETLVAGQRSGMESNGSPLVELDDRDGYSCVAAESR